MLLKSIYISKIGLVVSLFTSESLMYQCLQGFPYVAHLLVRKNPVSGPYVAMLLISLPLGDIGRKPHGRNCLVQNFAPLNSRESSYPASEDAFPLSTKACAMMVANVARV